MNVNELLDMLEEVLKEGSQVPFSGKRVVDMDQVMDVLDEVRRILPDEIRQSRAILKERADIIASARQEADALIRQAEDRARVLVSEQEITRGAQKRAAEQLATAQKEVRTMRVTVTEYCENMLRTTEEQLARSGQQMIRSLQEETGKNVQELKTLRENLPRNAKNS